MRLLGLGKISISQIFGSCDLPNSNFGLYISSVRYFGLLCMFFITLHAHMGNSQKKYNFLDICPFLVTSLDIKGTSARVLDNKAKQGPLKIWTEHSQDLIF